MPCMLNCLGGREYGGNRQEAKGPWLGTGNPCLGMCVCVCVCARSCARKRVCVRARERACACVNMRLLRNPCSPLNDLPVAPPPAPPSARKQCPAAAPARVPRVIRYRRKAYAGPATGQAMHSARRQGGAHLCQLVPPFLLLRHGIPHAPLDVVPAAGGEPSTQPGVLQLRDSLACEPRRQKGTLVRFEEARA